MNQSTTLSIREISRRTGIPESTLRYYRYLFPEYIPTVGSGRNRRHPEQAMAVFRRISRLFTAGESRSTVRRELGGASPARAPDGPFWNGEPQATVTRGYEVELAKPAGDLDRLDIEHLLTAMMVRDRELASMHRELLELLEKLLHALGSLASAQATGWRAQRTEPAIPPPRSEPAAGRQSPSEALELERLRESLQRERETVERLRHARLELEQRLARLEREGGGRRRKR
ncbi:MAG: MerR family transcriptional regulator [Gemmatimonadota bacterium]|nr:MAG: MerR family transcriptional regulator [Gemmatimonadota bacterium]